MSQVTSFLSSLPAFDEMVQAQQQLAEQARAAEEQAEAEAAEAAARDSELCCCVEAAYLIASADGVTSVEEVSHIVDRMCELTDAISAEDVGAMLAQAQMQLAAQGKDVMIASFVDRLRDEAKREAAFMVAANVSWTGGGIGTKEGLMLQAISGAFGWEMSHMHKLLGKARG